VKIIEKLLFLTFVVGMAWAFDDKQGKDYGTYIPWQPLVYTYKDYKGTPHIDSEEFGQISKQRTQAGECGNWSTKYHNLSIEELHKIINSGKADSDAYFEMHLRDANILAERKYLNKAADMGHINANIRKIFLETNYVNYNDSIKKLEEFDPFTSTSIAIKGELLDKFHRNKKDGRMEREYGIPMSKAGGDAAGIAIWALYRYMYLKIIEKDALCEAYYRGCDLYRSLQILKIKCGE
jgi:hypothetical protein